MRSSAAGRLRRLAAAARPAVVRTRREEDGAAMERLRGMARVLAGRFGLCYTVIEAERDDVVEHYGVCYQDAVIRIRLRHARTGRLLKDSSLVDTLCHELAHLKYFDHSPRFRGFYKQILTEARRCGYYRPGPTCSRNVPRQPWLFGAPPSSKKQGGGRKATRAERGNHPG